MRKLISYIAISLDGKIAGPNGEVDWLDEIPNPGKDDYGYTEFYESIDTTIMGNTTYQEVLGFGVPFPYPTKKNYVFTRNSKLVEDKNVTFISDDILGFTKKIKEETGKDIWLVGGGQLNTLMLNNGLLDELRVYVMPIILGKGIPIFSDDTISKQLVLQASRTFEGGVLELIYSLRD